MLRLLPEQYLFAVFLFGTMFCSGCIVNEVIRAETSELNTTSSQISENMLLDVGITNFDPGIPEDNDIQKTGIYPGVRQAETRFLPYHMKTTLQGTGFWGAVRVVPSKYAFSDILITGVIEKSDGEYGQLRIKVEDITGAQWFERSYSVQTGIASYADYRDRRQDPYQKIFNDFANDLRIYAMTLTLKDIRQIRQIAELKFFADMAPQFYGEHLIVNAEGVTTLNRLPAQNDPTVIRLRSIRARDYLVIDILNEHYANFYYGISIPYSAWRKISREEHINYRQVKRQGTIRMIMGAAVIIGSVAIKTDNKHASTRRTKRAIQNIGIREGWNSISAGLTRRREAKMHLAAVKELSESFASEAAPMTVTIDGEVRRLVGTAEAQYEGWRRIIRDIYQSETGYANNVVISDPVRE